ncbi:MAG TPA: fumarylacetoacetate hydrolase family protein [Bacteroidales bacterium]|nr:fumarylacetoacetate hydrolase family protein [Bacteroidales bacterium]HPR11049.1 fumarylacetoacetate hydrolase family protein [Bacteroidales bacterium]HRW84424.1 fumarylacetoacetate hydrolase family protein [Bacteroidales bacterium]
MKIICIGLNYRKHALEMGRDLPSEPVVFLKPDSSLLKNNKPFFLPGFSSMIQYEAEIVVKISRLGKGIDVKYARRYYDELSLGIDITARDIQNRNSASGLPWELSKCFDGAAPVGTFIPADEFPDSGNIDFSLEINGKVVQKASTADMIFSIDQIVSYVSGFFTLKTGDLIFTGTPSGVGTLRRNDHLTGRICDRVLLDMMIK